jgi:hypothetical protein
LCTARQAPSSCESAKHSYRFCDNPAAAISKQPQPLAAGHGPCIRYHYGFGPAHEPSPARGPPRFPGLKPSPCPPIRCLPPSVRKSKFQRVGSGVGYHVGNAQRAVHSYSDTLLISQSDMRPWRVAQAVKVLTQFVRVPGPSIFRRSACTAPADRSHVFISRVLPKHSSGRLWRCRLPRLSRQ